MSKDDDSHKDIPNLRSQHKLGRWKTVKKLFGSKDKTAGKRNPNDKSKPESDIVDSTTTASSTTQVQTETASQNNAHSSSSSEWTPLSPVASSPITDETSQVDPEPKGPPDEDTPMSDAFPLSPVVDVIQSTAEGTSVAVQDHRLSDGLIEVAAVLPGEPNIDTKHDDAQITSDVGAPADVLVLGSNNPGPASSATSLPLNTTPVADVDMQDVAPSGDTPSADTTPSQQPPGTDVHQGTLVNPPDPDVGKKAVHSAFNLNPDLSHSINGMYRILDLVSEQGSGGLVDKVVISQESLGKFMNDIAPGSYSSMTKVNFTALDKVSVRPVGIYGSRSEIIKFLRDIEAIDDQIAAILHIDREAAGKLVPTLRSGLYLLRSPSQSILYALYWPEDTTWNDDAVSSVKRNRITFMRYLTKIADQVIALISEEHANAIVWNDDTDNMAVSAGDEDEFDRLFTFKVAKTREQDEDVTSRTGFNVDLLNITNPLPDNSSLDTDLLFPRLVHGETSVGYMVVQYVPPMNVSEGFNENFTSIHLDNLLRSSSLQLSENLSEEALQVILDKLQKRAPEPIGQLRHQRESAENVQDRIRKDGVLQMQQRLSDDHNVLLRAVRVALVDSLLLKYQVLRSDRARFMEEAPASTPVDPRIQPIDNTGIDSPAPYTDNVDARQGDGDSSISKEPGSRTTDETSRRHLSHDIFARFPDTKVLIDSACNHNEFKGISKAPFKHLKEKLLFVREILHDNASSSEMDKAALITSVLSQEQLPGDQNKWWKLSLSQWVSPRALFGDPNAATNSKPAPPSQDSLRVKDIKEMARKMPDPEFLSIVNEMVAEHSDQPGLVDAVKEVMGITCDYFIGVVKKKSNDISHKIEDRQLAACKQQLDMEHDRQIHEVTENTRREFLQVVKQSLLTSAPSLVHIIQDIKVKPAPYYYSSSMHAQSYHLIGKKERQIEACLQHTIFVLQYTEQDKHAMQLDHSHIPTPKVNKQSSFSFKLPTDNIIVFIKLLQDERCLLITQTASDGIKIFLDRFNSLSHAVQEDRSRKSLNKDKVGEKFLITYDETKRFLAVLAVDKLILHVFVIDEHYTRIDGLGSSINLRPWYPAAQVKVTQMAFVCGASEELVLVDESNCARIYSLTTQQFRPASLQLIGSPNNILSSPDGSCLFTVEGDASGIYIRAYHWSNFGSTDGVCLELSDFNPQSLVATSIGGKTKVHIVGLDSTSSRCKSLALDITRKVTEFTFKEKGSGRSQQTASSLTKHNCIIDCHADVWTRFPVLPAVRRQTMVTSRRSSKSLLFVSHLVAAPYQAHFQDLIASFERTTRKPVDNELSSIAVEIATYGAFMKANIDNVSMFQAGEWLVDILCLIPIHIAVTRDNRFIPLKDGVWSNDVERSLLGATIDQIVDSLSFGWYESVFQSYMATKPVRVVSSMGEQSVGKSFALNHLVDTSFAGSAMRTTEGVWMSVTPTDDCLIVALDFEGVHSIERSAQEDSLLVLFNTAMSNLVLFRNNFALSRDITGLFQSFQSSSTVLDPAANPDLFQSTLVIIIKDVVDSDKNEITREFSLKFQKIVELEQGSNFITRLHAGNLAIIPWPVIESRQFYTLFPALKRMLDKQQITHKKAGIFLQTMKTLMAKLKVNDWGSLDQNLASHRAQQLTMLLPRALAFGATELEPEIEPLKDFDTSLIIDMPDSLARFYIPEGSTPNQARDQEKVMKILIESWEHFSRRFDKPDQQWTEDLSEYLNNLVRLREDHVREWLNTNSARFASDAVQFETIKRLFDNLVVSLKANTRLCLLQCSDCQLLCLRVQHHDMSHNCQTSHKCSQLCSFKDDHGESVDPCGLPAGHSGAHICDISEHLCGRPCNLSGKGGCLGRCGKVVNHTDEEHLCPAASHECGEHCSLSNIPLPDGSFYSCLETCRIPSNQVHDAHICETRSCPLTCVLCKRLCASSDHLHAMDPSAIHLCGQVHPCGSLCQMDGICQIDTAPQSVEATFTGTHETFQYTKYTQESKRLPCVIQIPPGDLGHVGKHLHSTDKNPFHFCKTRCEYCGYFCTLPLGHTQQEHETRHGSMSRTRWAVEGPDGSIIEVDGHKFGATDDGAPMLCSMVCRNMGRHIHVDYCRSTDAQTCTGQDVQHVTSRMHPNPHQQKDFITHALHWRRSGFKDPYSQEDRVVFAKCDSMCGGPEHQGDATTPSQPSYCNLPLFHAPLPVDQSPPGGIGYISRDGHHFSCRNPVQMSQAYHVMFVIDRSGSMDAHDRRPLANTPVTARISSAHNNRLGAVYSSLHAFWSARQAAMNSGAGQAANRRDAYSVVLFDHEFNVALQNDFTSTPDMLLNQLMPHGARGGTNYNGALTTVQGVMERAWSTERTPVVIFLSDGECSVDDARARDLSRRSIALGRALSFHAVAFGPSNQVLRRMAQVATDVQRQAPNDPMHPTVASSYTEALDSIRLAETFLGIANSLQKPRGSLMHN